MRGTFTSASRGTAWTDSLLHLDVRIAAARGLAARAAPARHAQAELAFWQLQKDSRDGSHGTRRERSYALAQMADTLHEEGYRGLRARNLKGKHVEALVREWLRRGLSDGTMKNRMAHLRWLAGKIGKPNIVKANADYGIGRRSHVADGTKRRDLDEKKLALVKDAHVRMALRLQAAFGLRREEAIKFAPSYGDRGDHVAVKASTAKGGRARDVPVLKDGQRQLLDEARRLAGGGAMIPPGRNYAEQKKVYEDQTRAAGLDRIMACDTRTVGSRPGSRNAGVFFDSSPLSCRGTADTSAPSPRWP